MAFLDGTQAFRLARHELHGGFSRHIRLSLQTKAIIVQEQTGRHLSKLKHPQATHPAQQQVRGGGGGGWYIMHSRGTQGGVAWQRKHTLLPWWEEKHGLYLTVGISMSWKILIYILKNHIPILNHYNDIIFALAGG